MNTLLAKLLGVDRLEGGQIEDWTIHWSNLETPFHWLLFILATGAAGYGTWRLYKMEPDYCSLKRKIWLTIFRTLGLFLLFVIIAGPVLRIEKTGVSKSKVVILVDTSKSMTRQDKFVEDVDILAAAKIMGDVPLDEKSVQKVSAEMRAKLNKTTRMGLVEALFENKELKLLEQLQEEYDVEMWTFDRASGMSPLGKEKDKFDGSEVKGLKADGMATEIGGAIRGTMKRLKGNPLAGMILVSDGGNNKGEEPTLTASDMPVPIFPIGIGTPQAKDITIDYIFMESKLFIDDPATVNVRIRQNGCAGERCEVVIEMDGEEMARESVVLNDFGEQTAVLRITPKKAGVFKVRVEVPPLDEEIEKGNNTKEKEIEVIDKKIKVLIVEGSPRWEYRYLKNALVRDKRVECNVVLRVPDMEELALSNKLYLKEFPKREDLFAYDVIVFGNVPNDAFWTEDDLENIRRFVNNEGGGIWMIAGKNHFPDEYKDSKLGILIPVEFEPMPELTADDEQDAVFTEGYKVALTPQGKSHSLVNLESLAEGHNGQDNVALWDMVPEMYWSHRSTRAKLNATVLLVREDKSSSRGMDSDRDGPEPLFVVARVGRGQVLYGAMQDLWRMRFPIELGPEALERFYAHAIQYLGLAHCLGRTPRVDITTDKEEYGVGDRVKVSAYVLDPETFEPSVAERIAGVGEDLENDAISFPFDLTPVPGQPGMYKGEFVAKTESRFRIQLDEKNEDKLEEEEEVAHANYRVLMPKIEMDSPDMKKELLDNIARASMSGNRAAKARMYLPFEASKIVEELKQSHKLPPVKIEDPLWDAPLMVILFTIFMGLEWFFRKRSDLI